MGAVSCLNRFNMLSLYAVLVLALSLNVDGKCQRGESSLCFVAEMPNLRLNKFCMEKNATRLAEGELQGLLKKLPGGSGLQGELQEGREVQGESLCCSSPA